MTAFEKMISGQLYDARDPSGINAVTQISYDANGYPDVVTAENQIRE